MRYVLIGAVILWIAYDVGSGALTGLASARQKELGAMPLPEMLEVVAGSEQRRIGDEWVDDGQLTGIDARGRTITYHVTMTRKTKSEMEAKWSRGWRSTMRRSLIEAACGSRLLGQSLSRGARVAYEAADQHGEPAFRLEVRNSDC